jgi:hypothetical protein
MSHTATWAVDPGILLPARSIPLIPTGPSETVSMTTRIVSLVARSSGPAPGSAVAVSLAILSVTAILQAAIYVATGSIALLADLVAGLIITGLILHITWESWRTVSSGRDRYR